MHNRSRLPSILRLSFQRNFIPLSSVQITNAKSTNNIHLQEHLSDRSRIAREGPSQFYVAQDKNIELACSILRSIGVKYIEEEEGRSIRFSFYSDIDMCVAFRNVRMNIDRKKEGMKWRIKPT